MVVKATRSWCHRLLPEPRYVPHAHRLVERGRDNHVLRGVELGAHHVVVVPGQDRDAVPALPVPDADGLVVAGGQDPWVLVVEHRRSDVVKMAQKGENATPLFIVPHFDLVVVTTAYKKRLNFVEVDSPHRSVVLVELVQECAHPIVPQLDDSIVKARKHPRPGGMEGEPLHPW